MNERLTHPWFEAGFYGYITPTGYRLAHEGDRPLAFSEAQGLFLWCPCGYGALDSGGVERYPLELTANKGRPHGLLVPFANPPSGVDAPASHGPRGRDGASRPRWTVSGSGLHDLTLAPSIAVGGGESGPECWHGFIENGVVRR